MKASSRTNAYGRNDGDIVTPVNMTTVFGTLGPEDSYFVKLNGAVLDGYPNARTWSTVGVGMETGTAFVTHLQNNVSTFITVTKFDTVVWSPNIPYALAGLRGNPPLSSIAVSFGYDPAWATVLERPGAMWANLVGGPSKIAWMPHTYASGHTVPMRAPAALRTDVAAWFAASPH